MGRPGDSPGGGLKKGPWTTSEDMILAEYVKKHGQGNWNSVQRNSSLSRCGKSCRLRWTNHLRPNLKKGAFTQHEQELIIRLHAKLGNKWACMAAQLPGRTDNEIKNFWNTRLKRRQRAGLPIYPQIILHQLNSSSVLHDVFRSPPLISPLQNQSNSGQEPLSPMPSLLQYNALDSGTGVFGLPSIQSPAASSTGDCVGDYEVERDHSKSGLLEDLLGDSHGKGKAFGFGHDGGNANSYNHYQGGVNTEASEEENSAMDNDLMNLLDNFPLSVPIPDWDEVQHGSESPRLITDGTTLHSQPNTAMYNPVANSTGAADQEYYYWNNMTSIY